MPSVRYLIDHELMSGRVASVRVLEDHVLMKGRDALGPWEPFGPGVQHRSVDEASPAEDGSKP